jgi:cytochrome bd-type quinol oxidase subunit 2
VPYLGSLILTHSLDGEIKGLKEFKPEDRPPVAIPFFAFRIMVGIGFLMLAVVAVSWWLRYRRRLFDSPWFLSLCTAMGPLGFVAVLAGWTTTEVGRQPWTVYGMLRVLSPVPIATALVAVGTWRALNGVSQSGPFIGAIGLFALSYGGIAISLLPMIVPYHYTLAQAAASPGTQAFLLVGTLFLLPIIFVYSGWSYWVFRGKVRADVGHH